MISVVLRPKFEERAMVWLACQNAYMSSETSNGTPEPTLRTPQAHGHMPICISFVQRGRGNRERETDMERYALIYRKMHSSAANLECEVRALNSEQPPHE